jgi:DDE superfamily endonuclease/Tc5 transposase DNA-binding domain
VSAFLTIRKKNTVLTYADRKAVKLEMTSAPASVVARKYGISVRTAERIAEKDLELTRENQKRKDLPKYSEVEAKVISQMTAMRANGFPVSGPLLKTIAKNCLDDLRSDLSTPHSTLRRYNGAVFSEHWLSGFKKRNEIRNLRINGERAVLPEGMVQRMEEINQQIASLRLPASSIYNWDETGLFYRKMPGYTLAVRSDTGAGAKEQKLRITALVCVNADSSDNSIVLIGTSATPRGSSEEFWRNLGIRYFSNENGWMDSKIFAVLLKAFDARLSRPTVLLLDNFAGHKVDDEEFKNLIIIWLPANSTSVTQPLDGGIIAAMKLNYRRFFMEFVVEQCHKGKFEFKQITVLVAAKWLKQSLDLLAKSTVQSCFARCLDMPALAPQETIDPISEMVPVFSHLMEQNLTYQDVQEFVNIDREAGEIDYAVDEGTDQVRVIDSKIALFYATELKEYLSNTNGMHFIPIMQNIVELVRKNAEN